MKVLFYVEPHPIRDTLVHFKDIGKRFLPLLNWTGSVDARLYANQRTLDALAEDLSAQQKDRIIHPTAEEEQLFSSFLADWSLEGIPNWLDLMAGGEVAEQYLNVLRRIYRYFPFDVIVHWGENGAVTRFMDERPVRRVAMELGCARLPFVNSVVMDPFGTNGSAVVPRLTVADIQQVVNGRRMSAEEAFAVFSERLSPKSYESWFAPLGRNISHQLLSAGKSVFLPLQLHDDANLLRFSKYETVAEVVLDVVPKLVEHGYTVIVKPHPASKYRQHSQLANDMARAALRPWGSHVVWCDDQDTSYNNIQLMQLADFVVTVNSSVGFEALYFDKPVVVLGDAVYKPSGLFPTLDQMLDGSFDRAVYLENVGYLRQFFLAAYLHPNALMSDHSRFYQMLFFIDGVCSEHEGDPLAVASAIYQHLSPVTQTMARRIMFGGLTRPNSGDYGAPTLVRKQVASTLQQPFCLVPCVKQLMKEVDLYDEEALAEWLDTQLLTDDGVREVITRSGLLDDEYYASKYPDVVKTGIDLLEHYTLYGLHEGRQPRPLVQFTSPDDLRAAYLKTASILSTPVDEVLCDAQAEPLSEEALTRRRFELDQIRNSLLSRTSRICVLLHLYYRDLVEEILEQLKAITEPFDLVVTLPTWGNHQMREMVRTAYPDALFYQAENRGRDIGPFMDVLPILIDKNYQAVLKLQTKRGYFRAGKLIPALGSLWREQVFDALLGSEERVQMILEHFQDDELLNMIGPKPFFLGLKDYPYHDYGTAAGRLLPEAVDVSESEPGFFAGTMFWVRPASLRALVEDAGLDITRFGVETGANDGKLAHIVERLLGHLARAAGGQVLAADVDLETCELVPAAPLEEKIDAYMTSALATKLSKEKEAAAGALAW